MSQKSFPVGDSFMDETTPRQKKNVKAYAQKVRSSFSTQARFSFVAMTTARAFDSTRCSESRSQKLYNKVKLSALERALEPIRSPETCKINMRVYLHTRFGSLARHFEIQSALHIQVRAHNPTNCTAPSSELRCASAF